MVRRAYRRAPIFRVRLAGIPKVAERLIQQALLQVLQPTIDPAFSKHSYGFRPGRHAHDVVLERYPDARTVHETAAEQRRSAVQRHHLQNIPTCLRHGSPLACTPTWRQGALQTDLAGGLNGKSVRCVLAHAAMPTLPPQR